MHQNMIKPKPSETIENFLHLAAPKISQFFYNMFVVFHEYSLAVNTTNESTTLAHTGDIPIPTNVENGANDLNTGAGTGSNTYQNTDNSVVNIQASINRIGGSISCYGIDTNGLATTR